MNTSKLIKTNDIYNSLQEILKRQAVKGVSQGQRKLRKGLHGKRIVFFPSRKNSALMPCESRLEADNCLDLEFDNKVIQYQTQPVTIDIGQGKSYTPDSAHVNNIGSIIVREAKVEAVLRTNRELRERLHRIKNILKREGIIFDVVTEQKLQQLPKLENLKLLYRYSKHGLTQERLSSQAQLFCDQNIETLTLKKFRELCVSRNLVPQFADILILEGYAIFNDTKPLNIHSMITLCGGVK